MNAIKRILHRLQGNKTAYIVAALVIVQVSFAGYLWGILQKNSGMKMNHEVHAKNDVKCETCHPQNASNPRFMGFEGHKVCSECHDEKIKTSDANACKFCHTRADNKTSLRKNVQLSPLVNFDHKKHKEADVKCIQCHENGTDSKKVSGNSMIPKMGVCVQCHKENKVASTEDCTTCHISGFELAKPLSHTPLWKKSHGKEVSQAEISGSCATCHTKKNGNDCLECHMKEKPSSHTIAWRMRGHAQYAQMNRESCSTCHKQSECITCHKTTPPVSHTGLWGSPYNRHCVRCHIEGESSGNYASGGADRNCGFCHNRSAMTAKHTAKPRPVGHTTTNCLVCHISALGSKHPYPATEVACRSCHQ